MIKASYITIITLCLILLAAPGALAGSATLTVKVEPFHQVIVQLVNANTNVVIETFGKITNVTGEVERQFTTTASEVIVYIWLKHPISGEKIIDGTEYVLEVEKEMFLDIAETKYQESGGLDENETGNKTIPGTNGEIDGNLTGNETEITGLNESDGQTLKTEKEGFLKKMTGFAISEETGKLSKSVYFIAVIFLVALVLLMIVMKRDSLVPKLMHKTKTEDKISEKMSVEEELEEAERKIKEAKEEIEEIKSRKNELTEVEEAEKEYERARIKLAKLKEKHDKTKDQQTEYKNKWLVFKEKEDAEKKN